MSNAQNDIRNQFFFERGIIMPRGDGTGPAGMGPMTGRAAGFCAGFGVPGYANLIGGRRFLGRGRGMGRGRGFGWARAGYGWPAWSGAVNPYAYGAAPIVPKLTVQQELEELKGQAEYLEDMLSGITKRIEELESQKSDK